MGPNCDCSDVVKIVISALLDVLLTVVMFGTFWYMSLFQSFGSAWDQTGNDRGFIESIQVVYLTVALMVLYILLDFTLITTTLINNKLLCWSCFVGSAITSLAFVGVALCLAFFGTAFLICLWVFSFKVFIIVRIHKYIEINEENKKKLSATAYLSTPEDGSQSVYLIHQQQFGGVDTSSLRKDEVNFIHTLKKPNTYLLPSYNAVSLECEEN